MAKKGKSKKDKEDKEKDENINEGTQEDINEADDSFGLPDIDYKPLDEIEEDKETGGGEKEPEGEEKTEAEEAEASDVKSSAEDEFEEDFIEQEEEFRSDEEEPGESTPPPGFPPERKFEHPKSSNAPKVIIGVLLAIIVLAAGYYFGIYKPQQAEKARQEQAEQERLAEEARQREAERQARLEEEQEAAAAQEEEEAAAMPETGEISILTESTGRYYVVIGSFIDDDLAQDYADKLAASGVSSMILPPQGEKGFYRLALSDYGSWSEAQSVADQMKGEYGNEVWVLKY